MAKRRHFSGQEKVECQSRSSSTICWKMFPFRICAMNTICAPIFLAMAQAVFEKGATTFENGSGKHERALREKTCPIG